ncbi:MAG: hypothetical protein ACREUQ_09785, partial [Burkholderiales bacterium]
MILLERTTRLTLRDSSSALGVVLTTDEAWDATARRRANGTTRVAWFSRQGQVAEFRVVCDVDLATAEKIDLNAPLPVVVPTLAPAGRPILVGHWDVSSRPEGVPHAADCVRVPIPGTDDLTCSCGAKAHGPGYGYFDAPGNVEVICRYADLTKVQRDRPLILTPLVAEQLVTDAAFMCRGVLVHLWGGTDAPVTQADELAHARREADRLGVPVWVYWDRGEVWPPELRATVRRRGPGLAGDVAFCQCYIGAGEGVGSFRGRVEAM